MISFEDISFTFANSQEPSLVIDHLRVAEGECLVLCGRSGSGKTTVTRLLNGLIPEFYRGELTGKVTVFDQDLTQLTVEALSLTVASVFQNPATQFFHRQVADELVFPCENQGVAQEEILGRLAETSRYFGIEALLEQDLVTASGGERQRIALATSYMQRPRVVVLDEPTANLDAAGIQRVHDHLLQLKAAGITVIIAEHRLDFLADIADRYAYFHQGTLLKTWSRDQWLALTNTERMALGLRGLDLQLCAHPPRFSSEKGLVLRDLRLRAGQIDLGQLADLHFPTDNITALVGPNGAGKSTLALLLAGLAKEDGDILLDGVKTTAAERLQKTAFVMQEVRLQLYADSVRKELLLGNQQAEHFDEIVDKLRLRPLLDRHPMSLSGGEQQRLVIAHALLSDKRLFIFDEPTSGLDYEQMCQFADLLQALKSPDRVIVVITHDIELIDRACQQIRSLHKV